MAQNESNIPFDKFANEDWWALSSLRALLFVEYRHNPHMDTLPETTVSLILQFDRHMISAETSGRINKTKDTLDAFAGVREPLFPAQELLRELKFKGYPVPDGLIEAREKGDWTKAEELLKKLHENMKAYVQSGGRIDKKQANDSTPFIKSLRIYCENDIEIKIQAPRQRPITCNHDSLGFRDTNTIQWKYLIGLLKNTDGTFSYSSAESAKKRAWGEIEKKIRAFLNKKFTLYVPDDFKLFLSVPGETGVRKPLFQITRAKDYGNSDFSSYDKEQITEKLKELARYPSDENTILYIKATERATELGMSDNEIENLVDIDNVLGGLDNPDSNDPDRDRWNIAGKPIRPEPDPYSTED